MKENKSIKNKYSRKYFAVVIVAILATAIILYKMNAGEEKYLVNEGVIEYTTSCIGYVIKDETVIDIDNNQILIPTISEGSRVSKNNIIATYRGNEYNSYQEKLQQIDNKILEAMENINVEYSIEISNLENQVVNSVMESQGISSMIEMQEYKAKINELLSKRATMIGELSPKDAYVKKLIDEREILESELKTSSSNIKAPVGGIISYSIDGLEEKLTKETITNLNYEDVKGYIEENKDAGTNKVKITNNYEAYILVRVSDVGSEYIKEGRIYDIKVIGGEVNTLKGQIKKVTETEQGYEVLFRVTNGVEHIIDSRECEVEIIWTAYEGLVVPLNAIKEDEEGKKYVTIITRGDYVDIPVKVQKQNETYAIVENYERENINDYILERYDQVTMQFR